MLVKMATAHAAETSGDYVNSRPRPTSPGTDEKDKQRVRVERQMKEIEERNKLLRLKWFEKNYKNVYCNPRIPKEKIPKKAEVLYNELQKIRQEKTETQEKLNNLERKPPKIIEIPDSEYLKRGPMYPVIDEVKEALYEGISHNDEGRKKYLKLRTQLAPHEKYYSKLTSSFEYGWNITETASPPIKDYGVSSVISGNRHLRNNGALNIDDPLRRLPFPSGHLAYEFL